MPPNHQIGSHFRINSMTDRNSTRMTSSKNLLPPMLFQSGRNDGHNLSASIVLSGSRFDFDHLRIRSDGVTEQKPS